MVTLNEYQSTDPIAWCPGCGNFGLLNALKNALVEAEKREIELYEKYKTHYSYGVYIARKLDLPKP